jgi:hypothetical protein
VNQQPLPSENDPVPFEDLTLPELIARCAEWREESRRLAERLEALTRTIEARMSKAEPPQETPQQKLSRQPRSD